MAAKSSSDPVASQPEASSIPDILPLLLPKDLVVFPGLIVPLSIADDDVIRMIDDVMQKGSRMIGAFLRKSESKEPDLKGINRIGCALTIHRMLRVGDGSIRMIVQGLERIELQEIVTRKPYPMGIVEVRSVKLRKTVRLEAMHRALLDDFDKMADLTPDMPEEFKLAAHNMDDPGSLVDLIASNLELDPPVRQQVLATVAVPDRIRLMRQLIDRELQILQLGNKIQSATRGEIEKSQREYFLRAQLRQIQKELGEGDEDGDIREWRDKVESANLPERVLEVANKELERLERMNPASAEYSVVVTYLDWLVALPWERLSEDNLDLEHAFQVLEADHYGLKDIKDRILEVLAVRKLKPDAQGPILCLAGPPGVGKTSLGQSIARAMNREFVRISLGGVRDEAEIRGHRRTYVGALPGRIVQALKRAKTRNPVFMLDEIDKLVSDFRGDPSSALLEVLDPAQNSTFSDHYIEIDFDLSSVFFITTANYLENVPPPLRDRMEIIRLPGYITDEKVQIARNYLVPRQIDQNGLKRRQISFHKSALEDIVIYYTREAGVRNLERAIGQVCRKVARKVASEETPAKVTINRKNLHEYLGPRKITPSWTTRKASVGVTNGLAYTPYGGDVLKIEAQLMPGKGGMRITGQLGDVMKESAQIALSWIRANQKKLGIREELFQKRDLHIHVPEGATPKDGPSAGVSMTTSLASIYTGRKVRSDVAMTGEITLYGHVLPIGGLREKTVAANRARISHVIIPADNLKDLENVPEDVRQVIEFHPVREIEEVLQIALDLPNGGGNSDKGSPNGKVGKPTPSAQKKKPAGKSRATKETLPG